MDGVHIEALNGLGVLNMQNGRLQAGLHLLEKSLRLNPNQTGVYINMGNALRSLGRFADALAVYDKALAIMPGLALGHFNRGNVLNDLGRAEEAVLCYERAIELEPGYVQAYFNHGNTLKMLGRLEEALSSYDRAVELRPNYAEAHYNRGYVLKELRRLEDALASCDRVVALMPGFPDAHYNRGNALQELGRYEEAIVSYDRALSLNPGASEIFNNRGNALRKLGRLEEALGNYGQAIAINPKSASAHNNCGNVLLALNRFHEAMEFYSKAMAIDPELPYVLGSWLHCKMHACDWDGIDELFARVGAGVDAGERVVTPFLFLPVPSTPPQQLRCAAIYARDKFRDVTAMPVARRVSAGGRIRIGYFSSDFRTHAMAYLIADMIERHDRSRFEIIAFSFSGSSDAPIRKRLEKAFDRFIDITLMSDREVVSLARELAIDIAVDLNGYTANNRASLFAARVAPVQVSHLGYPGTLGEDFVDYVVADRTVVPPEHVPHYAERVVSLPDTYWFNDTAKVISDRVFTRAELNLPEQAFVFCCFNNAYKITPDVFDIWMRLLRAVDGSVLWMLESAAMTTENLRMEAVRRGVDPDRLIFAQRMNMDEHLARHRQADLFLDTFYYNAHTTASDALWAGLPLLTCIGNTFSGRVAASLLRAMDMQELITETHADYEALATQLAAQPGRLAEIRRRLAHNRGVAALFDTARFTRNIEAAYQEMHDRWQAGLPPESFAIVV